MYHKQVRKALAWLSPDNTLAFFHKGAPPPQTVPPSKINMFENIGKISITIDFVPPPEKIPGRKPAQIAEILSMLELVWNESEFFMDSNFPVQVTFKHSIFVPCHWINTSNYMAWNAITD